MRIPKAAFRRALAVLGYELHRVQDGAQRTPDERRRSSEERLRYQNFASLSQAYELRLKELGIRVGANDDRPRLLARLTGTPPAEAYFIVHALAVCESVDGDVCEFGVAQGETSALIANEIKSGNRTLHLFDSFEGLSKPTDKDRLKDDIFSLGSMGAYAGTMAYPEEMVRASLAAVSFSPQRTIIHKGFIEQVLRGDAALPRKVSFAYVDFDLYEPIRATLGFLHRTTQPGSVIIVDDYDFFSTGAKSAVDEFLREKNARGATYEYVVPDPQYGYFVILTRKG